MVPLDGRLESPERTAPETDLSRVPVHQEGRRRVQVHGCTGSVLFRRLQTPGLLPVIQGDHGHPIRGEPSQVHLHVLGVVHLDAIQENAYVLTAEAPDIDGLEAAYASVILYLDTGEPAEDVGNLVRRRHSGGQVHLFGWPDHGEYLDGPDRSRGQRVRVLGVQGP